MLKVTTSLSLEENIQQNDQISISARPSSPAVNLQNFLLQIWNENVSKHRWGSSGSYCDEGRQFIYLSYKESLFSGNSTFKTMRPIFGGWLWQNWHGGTNSMSWKPEVNYVSVLSKGSLTQGSELLDRYDPGSAVEGGKSNKNKHSSTSIRLICREEHCDEWYLLLMADNENSQYFCMLLSGLF